jgi:hypothetical protein
MPRGARPKIYDAELVQSISQLYAVGMTQKEIAEARGVSQKVIWNVMRRHNLIARAAIPRDQSGEANANWKGDEAGKQAFHRRLYSSFGKPTKCSQCGTTEAKHYDYANLNGRYEDLDDYAPMCRSCHAKYDEQHLKFKGGMS